MLFTGRSDHSIDSKFRLAIPAKYRNQWNPQRDGSAWFCIPWPDRSLRLYTEASFEQLAAAGEGSLFSSQAQTDMELAFFSNAERLEMDSAGRIGLPRVHLEMVGFSPDMKVAVLGVRNHLQVRSLEEWEKEQSQRFENLPKLIEQRQQAKG